MPAGHSKPMTSLTVYVTPRCFGCAAARRLGAAASSRFPSLSVRIVDLEQEPQARPESLVAVPTYVLDGRIAAIGNPRREELFRLLEHALDADSAEARGRRVP